MYGLNGLIDQTIEGQSVRPRRVTVKTKGAFIKVIREVYLTNPAGIRTGAGSGELERMVT